MPFVYKQSGGGVVKQEVETGAMNDDEVVDLRGLDRGRPGAALAARRTRTSWTLVRLPGSATPPKAGGDTALTRRRFRRGAAAGAGRRRGPARPAKPPADAAREEAGLTRALRPRQRSRGSAGRSSRTSCSACAPPSRRCSTTSCAPSLTSLGILFGVASVIAMLAIGKGAEQEILEQMRLLGSNNIDDHAAGGAEGRRRRRSRTRRR